MVEGSVLGEEAGFYGAIEGGAEGVVGECEVVVLDEVVADLVFGGAWSAELVEFVDGGGDEEVEEVAGAGFVDV